MRDPAPVEEIFGGAMDLPPAQRSRFLDTACGTDAELRSEVESLLAADDSAHAFLQPSTPEDVQDPRIGTTVGVWRLLDCVGTGGMGRVYLAERADEAFEKRVAVKLLRTGLVSTDSLRRFELERQVLASLEHPNIARLIDGGATAEDIPYLVMEYVEGIPLHRYCDEHRLTVTERIGLLRSVCEAVTHAHRQLIVHRDLKPSNVLVTHEGVVKLLDFGVAKVLEEGGGPLTLTIDRTLTPRYASPEQIRGEVVTTASDVYSLGVMLFELLSGGRPYEAPSDSPLERERTMTQRPTRPSAAVEASAVAEREGGRTSLARRLRGDLDNIVLMAMRAEPERRYGSVQQLSDDLQRHLGGFPVMARPDKLGYRVGKFVARNRALVAAGALLVAVLVGAVAVSSHFALRAREQASLAQSRFDDVRALATTFLTDVDDAIATGGKTVARETIVSTGLEYLDRLAEEPGEDPRVLRDVARGYFRVASIQGDPKSPSLGDTEAALASAAKGQTVVRHLISLDPASTDSRLVEVEGHLLAGDLARHLGDSESAISHFQAGLAAREEVTARDPDSELEPPRLDSVVFRLGYALERWQRPDEAIEHLLRASALESDLIDKYPDQTNLFEAKATTLIALSQAYRLGGHPEKALELLPPLRERLIAEADRHPALRPTLANLRYNLGWTYVSEGDTARGIREIGGTVAFYRGLADEDPDDTTAHRNAASSLHDLAELEEGRGRPVAGLEHYEEMLHLRRHVTSRSPDSMLFRSELVTALEALAESRFRLGRRTEAVECQLEAVAMLSELAEDGTDEDRGRMESATHRAQQMQQALEEQLEPTDRDE